MTVWEWIGTHVMAIVPYNGGFTIHISYLTVLLMLLLFSARFRAAIYKTKGK